MVNLLTFQGVYPLRKSLILLNFPVPRSRSRPNAALLFQGAHQGGVRPLSASRFLLQLIM